MTDTPSPSRPRRKPLSDPRRLEFGPRGVAAFYPDLKNGNVFEDFGPNTFGGLIRRIHWSEQNPTSRALFVDAAEIKRVMACNPGKPLPAIVAQRLAALESGKIQLRGRRPLIETPIGAVRHDAIGRLARRRYNRARRIIEACRGPRSRLKQDHALTPAKAAAEIVRRRLFPFVSTIEGMQNLLSEL